jgi:hypothetical protein
VAKHSTISFEKQDFIIKLKLNVRRRPGSDYVGQRVVGRKIKIDERASLIKKGCLT